MARRRGEGVLGGDRAGEGWAREMELTSGSWLPARGVCERGRERGADGRGPDVSGRKRRADWAAWAGKRGGDAGARELGWKSAQPREGREFSFFFSYSNSFLFPFLLLCLFVSFSFETKNIL